MKGFIACILLYSLYATVENHKAKQDSVFEIAGYHYPLPSNDKKGMYTIAIVGTNDIHGAAFPLTITHPIKNFTYKYGGLQYLASNIKVLRKHWGERLLWLDGGDQFQGGIESRLSNGSIITDFFNMISVNSTAIGNHEFDFGKEFLLKRLQEAKYPYLAANIFDNTTNKTGFMPNTEASKIFKVGDIKVGVVGLTTLETAFKTSGNISGMRFAAYKEVVESLSKELKNKGADAVVLVTHVGLRCKNGIEEAKVLKMRNVKTKQEECSKSNEMHVLLDSLKPGTIDAVVGGHTHDLAHLWVNGVPVVQNVNGGFSSNVIYLTFNLKSKILIDTKIEGPIPTCEKVFANTKRCEYLTKEEAKKAGKLVNFKFHGEVIKPDKSLQPLFDKWWKEVFVYKQKISSTEVPLITSCEEENVLGNLVADSLKNISGSNFALINCGALRTTWFPGDITVEDVYNMSPFDTEIVKVEMSGEELKRMLKIVESGAVFNPISGAALVVTAKPKLLLKATFYNQTEIQDNATYTFTTLGFLIVNGGGQFKDVITWYKARIVGKYGFLREILIEYLKTISVIRQKDYMVEDAPRLKILNKLYLE